jgi:hypothetical protein
MSRKTATSASPLGTPVSLRSLRAVLWVDTSVFVFLWGVPAVVGSTYFASLWGLIMPNELIYVRLIGVLSISWGLLLFLTVARPMRNVDVLRVTIMLHVLVAGMIMFGLVSSGVTGLFLLPNSASIFWLVTVVVNLLLAALISWTLPHPIFADSVGKSESARGWKRRRDYGAP